MAIASRWLAQYFNRPNFELFNFNTYAICGDGCLMEGISGEAASIAGHLKLSNLCWIYDNNQITIEGKTSLAYSDDVKTRFEGYGWNVTHVTDANDCDAFAKAIRFFQDTPDRPTMIIVDSHIGYGSPHRQDTKEAHGEALGEEEVRLTKKFYGWPEDAKFLVPDGVKERFQELMGKRGRTLRDQWTSMFADYKKKYPDLADALDRMEHRQLPDAWDKDLPTFPADAKGLATRDSGGKVLNQLAKNIPWLVGGSADLYPSTKTLLTFDGAGQFEAGSYGGRNFHFGIREHGMGAIANGMTLVEAADLRLDIFQLQRLHEGLRTPLCNHGDSGHLRLHPRLHQSGRGRAHPSAHRAACATSRHAWISPAPPGRCERGSGILQSDHAIATRAGRVDFDSASRSNL